MSQIGTGLAGALLAAAFLASAGSVTQAATPPWAADCAELDDDAARLTCYDSHNPPRKSSARAHTPAISAKPATAATPTTPATPAAVPNDFGLSAQREREAARARAAEPTDLVAQVATVSERLTGELLLKLDNGQSWTQAQRKSGVLIKSGERVTISRGAFGGYLLRSESGATMRVRRLE